MNATPLIDIAGLQVGKAPFPHFYLPQVLPPALEQAARQWLANTKTWDLTRTDFYEQYEFSLFDRELPLAVQGLLSAELLAEVKTVMEAALVAGPLELVGATVHKLTDGQRIGVHNDFIGTEESHRLLVQLNAGWKEDHGGYLLLFHSANAEDVSELVLPVSNSAFGFEISPSSYHAVSTVYDFARYTLVYTFKRQAK